MCLFKWQCGRMPYKFNVGTGGIHQLAQTTGVGIHSICVCVCVCVCVCIYIYICTGWYK